MLTTRPEIVKYLVSQGHPQNLAKVAVSECFDLGTDGSGSTGEPDKIWSFEFDSRIEPVASITEQFALEMYVSMLEHIRFGHNCICVCDEPKYNMNGDPLP